jgi:hypothetical protein
VREEPVNEEGVYGDYDERTAARAGDCSEDGYAFVDGIGVLEGDVVQRKVLVVWFDSVQDVEAYDAGAVKLLD